MKKLFYALLKPLIRTAFRCYYQRLHFEGMEQVPADKPVVLLPNHQNALLDPLIYAAFARARKPYFLTRSDVFRGGFLEAVFEALRMIPIYRMRDGRHTLKRNAEVFDRCAALLAAGEHLLLFPEANHNLKRQVRPLSKGFTRIVQHAMELHPGLDLQLVPVGINYQDAAGFPDRVTYMFGAPIPASRWKSVKDPNAFAASMKQAVFEVLSQQTTHADPERDYETQIQPLEAKGADFLQPAAVNAYLKGQADALPVRRMKKGGSYRLWDLLFRLVNFPVWLPWRWVARHKVWEPEFLSTFRFGFAIMAFPVYLLLLFLMVGSLAGWVAGLATATLLFLHNLAYVKTR
ncbi:1-acyl-sn-glycerol-3-phosphate acyltransferase [Robiginitalea sp. M366]|uniref:1-acyl-sn-glycerol-3-phosphate acyltransferase n=1 Tax=Robiginitalea aestuariiviva TaxID=3036903 RepID=UPI00240D27C0|nr:1-acyl-sn-glycerol-3-phosphate acyltransferase [Robiginitalea aestuariiviva]MDG1572325.1 1-acyl-sn-glycerol-3-phosphate acyltransferase [Robiginitalea aestuariiviva]